MRISSICLLSCCCALSMPWAAPAVAQQLKIFTSDVPPLAFPDGKGGLTGFCIEIIEEIQRRIGSHAEIRELPWTRAYKMAQSTPEVMLVCPKRTAAREAKFKWVGPVRISEFNLYSRKDSPLRIDSLQDAKQADGIVVARESFSYRHLHDEGFDKLEPVNNSAMALRMLLAGRRPLMAIDQEQMQMLLERVQFDPSEIRLALRVMPTQSYLLFSKSVPDALVASWQAALDALKADGTFARLHKKWFPLEPVSPALLRRASASAPGP